MEIVRLREREIERKEWQNNGGTHLLPLKSEQSKPKVMHSALSIDVLLRKEKRLHCFAQIFFRFLIELIEGF